MAKKRKFDGYTEGRQEPLGKGGPDRRGYCNTHDKSTWASRKAARRAAKNRHPNEHKPPYRCTVTGGWHYGTLHLSRETYRGLQERDPEEES